MLTARPDGVAYTLEYLRPIGRHALARLRQVLDNERADPADPLLDWAEDTALLRSNRSADPVAETEERAVTAHSAARASSSHLRDRHQSVKPSRQDAATAPAGCTPAFDNSRHPFWLRLGRAKGSTDETRVERGFQNPC